MPKGKATSSQANATKNQTRPADSVDSLNLNKLNSNAPQAPTGPVKNKTKKQVDKQKKSSSGKKARSRLSVNQYKLFTIKGTEETNPLISSFMSSDAGHSTLATKEVLYKAQFYETLRFAAAVADPPEDARSVFNLLWDLRQDFTGTPGKSNPAGQGELLARPVELYVYAYPKSVNADNAGSIYSVISSVPVRNQADGSSTALFNANQDSCIIPPTFNPKWQLVNHVNYTKLFRDAQIQPHITFAQYQRLIQISCVKPENLAVLNDDNFLFKFVLMFRQTQPTTTSFSGQLGYTASFANAEESVTGTTGSVPCFIQPIRMSDST